MTGEKKRQTIWLPIAAGVAILLLIGVVVWIIPSEPRAPGDGRDASLTGDGEERSSERNGEFVVYNFEIWSDVLNEEFKRICIEWGRTNNVDVTVRLISLDDIDSTLTAFVDTKTGPDIAVFPAHKIAIYHQRLLDLTPLANEVAQQLGGFYPIASEMTSVNGRYFGIPLYAWSHLWVYRQSMGERLHRVVQREAAR